MQKLQSDTIDSIDNILLKQKIATELYSYKDRQDIVTYNKVKDVAIVGDDLRHDPVKSNSQLRVVVLMKFEVETDVKNDFTYAINNSGTAQSHLQECLPEEVNSIRCVGIMHESKVQTNTIYKEAYSLSNEEFIDISLDS
jgi:hypothetical protein